VPTLGYVPDELPLDGVREEIATALASGRAVFLVCSCSVDYVGRAKSSLGPGERMIIIKEDGTVIIHQRTGRNPVNWMPPKTRMELVEEDGRLSLTCSKHREGESMRVTITSASSLQTFRLEDYERLELYGTEKDFVRALIDDPSLIEKGFRMTKNERITIAGSIDISGVDAEGNPVAVEVKRSRANPQDVIQLKRYVDILRKRTDQRVRGILVAPSSSSKARRLLVEYGLELKRVSPLKPRRGRSQSNLSKFVED
jgi:RecB family endonuclease NucS